jgi:serine/threonine protein kinase
MPLSPGTRLGPYEIVAPLGAGGMGEVFRARDPRLGRDVAIKVLPERLSSSPDARARFEREARTVSQLNHPHICTLHDVGRTPAEPGSEGTDYLVMELVEGETLATRLERGSLPVPELLVLGRQIADALDRAHRAGVVHRDLKPGNVMLTRLGAKLMDFGLARPALPGPSDPPDGMSQMPTRIAPLTAEGAIVGTFQYMSPEQLEGRDTDERCDLWAFGCLLYEMATGRPAFEGSSAASLISAVMKDDPRPVGELVPATPVLLDQLIRACLVKDPEARWPSARAAAIALGWPSSGVAAGTLRQAPGAETRQFLLSAAHVRQLTDRNPKLVGHPVYFTDNRRSSDRLVVYLSGLGLDSSRLEHVVQDSDERSIVVTLPGFAAAERWRPALGVDDHSRILRFLLRELVDEVRPARVALVGHATGADQILRMVHDEAGAGVPVDGLVALSPNVSLATCRGTRQFARIDPANPEQTLASLKRLASEIDSIEIWLQAQHYISQTLLRLGPYTETLRRYSAEIVAPFEGPGDPFSEWYRTARRKIPRVRLVFSGEETADAEELLGRHLEHNILGEDLGEDAVLVEAHRHLELLGREVLARHVAWALDRPVR